MPLDRSLSATLLMPSSLMMLSMLTGCGPKHEPRAPTSDQPATTDNPGVDPGTGLIRAPGWEHVATNCNACHSTRHFLRMRGDRETWDAAITWMQQGQGLWPLTPGVRATIVNYLATNYGPNQSDASTRPPKAAGFTVRRPPLPAALLPRNPY